MKNNKKLKGIIIGVVSVLVIALIASVVLAARPNDEIDLKFSIGGLSDAGTYEESEDTLYTKEAFECVELTARLDFDSNIKYQFFFYDSLDEYVSSSEVYTKGAELSVPEGASRVRVEITPIWGSDVEDEDRVINWYDKSDYADQLHIEVVLLEDVEENASETPDAA